MYPACDPRDSTHTGYSEESHNFEGFVSPNFTTYVKISAKTFHFSEEVKLEVVRTGFFPYYFCFLLFYKKYKGFSFLFI